MTAAEIAETLDLPLSTVSLWLKRIGLGKRSRLEPLEPPNRYERRHPGELVHVDIKQLSRISIHGAGHRLTGERSSQRRPWIDGRHKGITGYEYLHVIVDDYTSCPPCGRAVDDFRAQHGITDPLVEIDEASVYWRKTA